MASVVLSFVGTQDPVSEKNNEEGSIVSLLRHLIVRGNVIKQVFLLYTTGTAQRAQETRDWLTSQPSLAQVPVQIIPTSKELSDDPTDLLEAAKEARRGLEQVKQILAEGDRIEFNASSGTPAMKSSFSILQAAGYAPQSTVWQVRNPSEMKEGQSRVFATDVSGLRREFELRAFMSQVENYNYDGAYALFSASDMANHFSQRNMIIAYLRAGMSWQRSKLDNFRNHISEYLSEAQQSRFCEWYYPAYEEAYLAIVRLRQGNIVEAFFHGFRAFEGILACWGKRELRNHIEEQDGAIYLKKSIFNDEERYFKGAEYSSQNKPKNDIAKFAIKLRDFFTEEERKEEGKQKKNYLLDFSALCKFLRAIRNDYKIKCPQIKDLLTDGISKKRNTLVHQLSGLSAEDLCQFWQVSNEEEWENKILEFLNFIAEQSFTAWQDVCLMPTIHQQILAEIRRYQAS